MCSTALDIFLFQFRLLAKPDKGSKKRWASQIKECTKKTNILSSCYFLSISRCSVDFPFDGFHFFIKQVVRKNAFVLVGRKLYNNEFCKEKEFN